MSAIKKMNKELKTTTQAELDEILIKDQYDHALKCGQGIQERNPDIFRIGDSDGDGDGYV